MTDAAILHGTQHRRADAAGNYPTDGTASLETVTREQMMPGYIAVHGLQRIGQQQTNPTVAAPSPTRSPSASTETGAGPGIATRASTARSESIR